MDKSNMCIYISENNKCKSKPSECYGGYCKKHKNDFLFKDELINLDHFTGNSKDYKLSDLKLFCNNQISKSPSKFKKADYFQKIHKFYKKHKLLLENIDSIHKIQKYGRRWLISKNCQLRGLAYLNRGLCNNDEDFYSYDSIQDIEPNYFFSYKDSQNNYWGFDIRSLKKLIDMNYSNPYTIEPFPEPVKEKILALIKHLDKGNIQTVIDTTIVADRKVLVKQKFVDIFAQMELVGHSCNVEWILDLSSSKLKRLYRELEDIWNYRANLSEETKRSIIYPDGRLCVMPIHDYNNCSTRVELQEILANEVLKICNAPNQGNMSLGFMYFIIALSHVSRPCYITHSGWVQYSF